MVGAGCRISRRRRRSLLVHFSAGRAQNSPRVSSLATTPKGRLRKRVHVDIVNVCVKGKGTTSAHEAKWVGREEWNGEQRVRWDWDESRMRRRKSYLGVK